MSFNQGRQVIDGAQNVFKNVPQSATVTEAFTVSSGTPLLLTVNSTPVQTITGTTAQTINLPGFTGVVAGFTFTINNQSSANITVKAADGTTVSLVGVGAIGVFRAAIDGANNTVHWAGDVRAGGNVLSVFNSGQIAIAQSGTQTLYQLPSTGTPAASTLAMWDAQANVSANNFLSQATYTAASATPITMTLSSTGVQVIFGTTTPQTIKLPTTGIPAGYECTVINGISSANVTVQASDGTVVATLTPGQTGIYKAYTSTPTSYWQWIQSGSHLKDTYLEGVTIGDISPALYINGDLIQSKRITSQTTVTSPMTGRLALLGEMTVNSVGTLTLDDQNFIGTAGLVSTSANLGGTALQPLGQLWGGWFTAGTEGGTYHAEIFGIEIDVQCKSNYVAQKIGMRICLGTGAVADDTVRGTYDDTALNFIQNTGAMSWAHGIKFGTDQQPALISEQWPFNNTSTIIGTCAVDDGLPANIGIDFSNVTFTGPAFKTGAAPIAMGEMGSAPSGIASTGQIYVGVDGSLHYLSPGGNDTMLAEA